MEAPSSLPYLFGLIVEEVILGPEEVETLDLWAPYDACILVAEEGPSAHFEFYIISNIT
jgi:hypothetical protein